MQPRFNFISYLSCSLINRLVNNTPKFPAIITSDISFGSHFFKLVIVIQTKAFQQDFVRRLSPCSGAIQDPVSIAPGREVLWKSIN